MQSIVEIEFQRGTCPIYTFGPLKDRSVPVVLLFMDAFGPRDALFEIAKAIESQGYRVLLPDLFYEHRPYRALDPHSLFTGGEDRQRLGQLLKTLTQKAVDADVEALLAFCQKHSDNSVPFAAVGYCMGGRYALTAATLETKVAVAATFHASTLAPREGDGPHQRFADTKAHIYIGVADIDPSFDAEEEGRLANALRQGKVDHVIETYSQAAHGFAMMDLPVYNAAAAAKHLSRLIELLDTGLRFPPS